MSEKRDNINPTCIVVHPSIIESFESLAEYVPATSQIDNIAGTYKDIPIVTSNSLQEDEIYYLVRGNKRLDEEPFYVKLEEENE